MLTGFIGGLMGLVTSLAPAFLKEMQDTRNHKRELEHLEAQHRMQLERARLEAESKIREADAATEVAHYAAVSQSLADQMKPTGFAWIDGFNALIRPLTSLVMLTLFLWTSFIFVGAVVDAYGAGKIKDEIQLVNVIWGSMIGEAIWAVFGYWFVARETRKKLGG